MSKNYVSINGKSFSEKNGKMYLNGVEIKQNTTGKSGGVNFKFMWFSIGVACGVWAVNLLNYLEA